MNRTIKFRCWNKKEKKMYFDITDLAYTNSSNGFELMQFTGLLDKNGKEIYEGDIMALKTKGIFRITVRWNERTAKFIAEGKDFEHQMNYTAQQYEVIGNIYENP